MYCNATSFLDFYVIEQQVLRKLCRSIFLKIMSHKFYNFLKVTLSLFFKNKNLYFNGVKRLKCLMTNFFMLNVK